MKKVFSKFTCLIRDLIDDYIFDGTLTINSPLRKNQITGDFTKNGTELGSIIIEIDFDNTRITRQEFNMEYNWISKDIVNQFIDRFIEEANILYGAFIQNLNS